jgi:DNA-binding response OmpR family regulator
MFEPFFTTKPSGQGTGLGLSMVHGIVVQSGGHINVYSEPGHGTSFKIYLPTVTRTKEETDAPRARLRTLRGNETILVVEDQADVRDFAVAVLKAYGYRVMQAPTASEALLVFEHEGDRIDLLLTDVVMPNMSGRQLAERVLKTRPDIKVLFMSGYMENVIVHHGILDEGVALIQKPFSPEELASKVRAVLGPAAPMGRILVVDQDRAVRSFLRTVLEAAGYEVSEAKEGSDAVPQAQAQGVDLVIADLVSPEQEGPDPIQVVQRRMPGVGIIAIAGASVAGFPGVGGMLGADAVLNKPVTPERLLATVADQRLRLRGRRRGPM